MNEEAVQALIASKPKFKRAKDKLLAMKPGSYCIHRSWGFGKIVNYDKDAQRLIIDFDDKPSHSMDPTFCVDTMEVLDEDHILTRSRNDEETVTHMLAKQPTDVIHDVLIKLPGQKGVVLEINKILIILMGEVKAKKWWTNARKHISKDSRIGMPVRKTDPYFIRDEPVSREDELFDAYDKTTSAQRKLKLVEELVASENIELVKTHLAEIIEEFSTLLAETHQLSLLEKLHAAWVRDGALEILEREKNILPLPEELVAQAPALDELANSLPGPYQSKLLALIETTHPDSWTKVILELFKASHGKFTTECVSYLFTRDFAEDIKATLERWLVEQSLKAPVIIWVIKNRNSRKYSTILADLINPRLFTSILYAIDHEALQSSGTRRVPLADLLSDDQELIHDLMAEANPETARDLANSLLMNQGFDELSKKSILARMIKLFPNIQTLLDSSSEPTAAEDVLHVSEASFDTRKEEYDDLVQNKIPENKTAIAVAREHGDLKENSEYKMARQDQTTLMARKGILENDLSIAQITDFTEAPTDVVGIGSTVSISDPDSGESITYHLLGAWDGDPEKNILSYKTPLGQGLIGHGEGEEVEVEVADNKQKWIIKSISRYVDN